MWEKKKRTLSLRQQLNYLAKMAMIKYSYIFMSNFRKNSILKLIEIFHLLNYNQVVHILLSLARFLSIIFLLLFLK